MEKCAVPPQLRGAIGLWAVICAEVGKCRSPVRELHGESEDVVLQIHGRVPPVVWHIEQVPCALHAF